MFTIWDTRNVYELETYHQTKDTGFEGECGGGMDYDQASVYVK